MKDSGGWTGLPSFMPRPEITHCHLRLVSTDGAFAQTTHAPQAVIESEAMNLWNHRIKGALIFGPEFNHTLRSVKIEP